MPFLGTTGGGSVKQYGGQANLGYFIKNSLRTRSSASAYLNRTPATATNQKVWTWSAWVKRGTLGTDQSLFATTSANFSIFFGSGNDLRVWTNLGNGSIYTSAVYRDTAAWYHIVLQRTSVAPYFNLYVNGVQVTSFAYDNRTTYPGTADSEVNSTVAHYIGGLTGYYFDGYQAEINFIDGQALTPSSFGKTDAVTGQWIPKKFAGTYGTNGFYLKFADTSGITAATIGKDSSGNGNNWTPSGISNTTGATYDFMIDSPSLSAVASNYCTWNPLFKFSFATSYAGTFSNGNLQVATGGNATQFAGTMELCDGAYYEVTAVSIDVDRSYIGLFSPSLSNLVTSTTNIAYDGTYNVLWSNAGQYFVNTTTGGNAPGSLGSWTNGSVISVAYKAGKIYFAKDGVWQNSAVPASGTGFVASGWDAYGALLPYCGFNSTFSANFGQQPFSYTPPSGFKALNAFNLS